jgi:hypothetical protein
MCTSASAIEGTGTGAASAQRNAPYCLGATNPTTSTPLHTTLHDFTVTLSQGMHRHEVGLGAAKVRMNINLLVSYGI